MSLMTGCLNLKSNGLCLLNLIYYLFKLVIINNIAPVVFLFNFYVFFFIKVEIV